MYTKRRKPFNFWYFIYFTMWARQEAGGGGILGTLEERVM